MQRTKIERLLRATFSTLTRGPSWFASAARTNVCRICMLWIGMSRGLVPQEAPDLNLFYGNCDLDPGNIRAWKNSKHRRNSDTRQLVTAMAREEKGQRRKIKERDNETIKPGSLIDLIVTLELTSIFQVVRSSFFSRSRPTNRPTDRQRDFAR